MISYAGVPLIQPTTELNAWLAARIPVNDAFEFFRPPCLTDDKLHPRQNMDWFLDRGVRINTFFHPWGASRWGIGYFLANEVMLALIRAQAGSALPLIIADGNGRSMTTNLWMLPAVPLAKFDPTLNLWMIVLVDDRYYWWERAAALTVTEGTTTWAEVYAAIGTALGNAIVADSISSAYLFPGSGLAKQYEYLPMILDQAAGAVGQRIVRHLNGTIYARSVTTAQALMTSQAALYRKYAGGSLSLGGINV